MNYDLQHCYSYLDDGDEIMSTSKVKPSVLIDNSRALLSGLIADLDDESDKKIAEALKDELFFHIQRMTYYKSKHRLHYLITQYIIILTSSIATISIAMIALETERNAMMWKIIAIISSSLVTGFSSIFALHSFRDHWIINSESLTQMWDVHNRFVLLLLRANLDRQFKTSSMLKLLEEVKAINAQSVRSRIDTDDPPNKVEGSDD